MSAPVRVVLPGDVDDPASPSGGNRYDRRICDGLTATREVHEIAVAGTWPAPDDRSRRVLAAALAEVPDGGTVLLDGLVGGCVPELLEAEAHRLRLVLLVHLPLAAETGLAPAEAHRLDALERRAVHAVTAVVATSSAAAAGVAARHGLPAGSVRVVAPGVDPAPAVAGSPDGRRLVCVAAVVPRKGQDVLATALTRVTAPWECACVGSTGRDPAFAAAVQRINPRITFPGTRTGAGLDEVYAAADLLVLPSRAETYGMVVTEALARAIPVLATAADGVAEAIGRSPGGALPGALVPPGDPAALAAALTRWLTEPALRADWRRAATETRATLRGWPETTRQLSEVLSAI